MPTLLNDPSFGLHRLHQGFRQACKRRRFSRARSDDPRKELAGYVEQAARARLEGMGLQVSRTGYNDPWDLWCEGARVEVKGASWSGRYQAAIRNHEADLLLLGCVPGEIGEGVEWFVIPAERYAHTNNIAIWTAAPADYGGQWAEFYRAWWWVDVVVQRTPAHRGWQLALFAEVTG